MPGLFFGTLNPRSRFVAVIMAGGSGTRFWPLSRERRPKQFLALGDSQRSLIGQTGDRFSEVGGEFSKLVVCAESQVGLVREELPDAAVLAEPCPRNTAPCIGFAAKKIIETIGDVPMVCVPADHLIDNPRALAKSIDSALSIAKTGAALVTIGIPPTHPETGYGYIQRDETKDGEGYGVRQFVEKPNAVKAAAYLRDGRYLWNSGMFVWRPSVILDEISRQLPKLAQNLEALKSVWDDARRGADIFSQIEPVSIDYGVMEKAKRVYVVPGEDLGWSDIGSWASWVEVNGNGVSSENVSRGDVMFVESEGCGALSTTKLIAAVGLKDVVIVETEDAILVCEKGKSQEVRKVVERLKRGGRWNLC